MTRRVRLAVLGGVLLSLAAAVGLIGVGELTGEITKALAVDPADAPPRIALAPVAHGVAQPTDIQFVPGLPEDAPLAVVLEKGGHARLLDLAKGDIDAKSAPLVVDVPVRDESEMGLLGLAFHPRFRENGLFYTNSNPGGGERRTRITEFRLARAEMGVHPAEEKRVILEVAQPYSNHKGGQLAFGPDGYLYIGFGDGGSANDPHGNGQNLNTLLGKMIRIDVDHPTAEAAYAVPKDNPFVGRDGARPEIWAYGLRNPWRFSFDPKGRLIVADVGQDAWEEVDLVERGQNLGWNLREARHCFPPKRTCTQDTLVDPIYEYGRRDGQSITGGYVYLGVALADVREHYVFGDFMAGRIWELELPAGATATSPPPALAKATLLGHFPRAFSTFGRDAHGEIYVADFMKGEILKLGRLAN